jgi:hypothetical protein
MDTDLDFTHAYCEPCGTIRPVIRKPLQPVEGEYAGGDLVCGECRNIIATVYTKIQDNLLPPGTIKRTPDQ